MKYYIRKISRAKWLNKIDYEDEKYPIFAYMADTISNDLRIQAGTLSVWESESIDSNSDDFKIIIAINSLLGDRINRIELLCIPGSKLESYELKQEDGNTILDVYKDRHYNIKNLSVRGMIKFASEVVLPYAGEKDNPNIIRVTDKEQCHIIKEFIDNGIIKLEDFKDGQREDYLRIISKEKI